MIKQLGLTNQFSGGVRTEFLPAPRLGENTLEVMQEFGFTTEEIETAVEQKAVFKFV
jgi:crotonobetainyl-CoA:carnitine CoA-transferase CaiB-like acyl-CoA transferase